MNYGDRWPIGPQSGGPAITPPAPIRDRAERVLAYEVWKLNQADAAPEPVTS